MNGEKISNKLVNATEVELKDLRQNFTKLMLSNPNYFGSIPGSKHKSVMKLAQNTNFEDISYVGFNPAIDTLYAIVRVKQCYGYSGSLCKPGSTEYVRFYIDWNGDGDFQEVGEDVGVASVNVHDIPGAKPLNYSVSVKLNPKKKPCTIPQVVKVRAVLSWNAIPPANTPNYNPVWGEVQENWIQIKPGAFLLGDLINYGNIKIDESMMKYLQLDQAIDKKIEYTVDELKNTYGDKVQDHRLHAKEVSNQMLKLSKNANIAAGELSPSMVQLPDYIKKGLISASAVSYNVQYEELKCLGLQYNNDTLTAVVTVKLPCGYSGGLCSKGSQEYVAFWADWDNDGVFEEYMGTAVVNVHDIPSIPAGGIQYAVSLPVSLAEKKKLCNNPQVVNIRATLSWEVPPANNPEYTPIWGNSIDSLIQIQPGTPVVEGEQKPFISAVGDMDVMDINSNGYANGTHHTGFVAVDSPFGGWMNISLHISNAPNISAGQPELKYQVLYKKFNDSNWTKITNKFPITISQFDGFDWTQIHMNQIANSDGCYLYREDIKTDLAIGDKTTRFVENFLAAQWYTGGLDNGLYELKVIAKTASGDAESNIVRVRIDNKAPDVELTITEIVTDGLTSSAKPCGTFKKGCTIKGKFTASDNHFKNYTFAVEPSILNPNPVSPLSEGYPAITGAYNKDWELNTTNMEACGYVLHLHVYDRTIVSNSVYGWYNKATVGFCLVE